MGARMTIQQADALGLLDAAGGKKPKARKRKGQPQPLSRGEEQLALHLKAHKIQFRREYEFHPARHWKLDFALVGEKLAIEVEGGIALIGRHQRPEGFIEDMYKYNALIVQGWRLLRFSTHMVMTGEAIETVLQVLGIREVSI